MVIGHEKWVTYYNIVQKRSWSKCSEAAQTVAKPGLTAMKSGPGTRDYHPFLTLQNFLSENKLGPREDCENRLLDVFANKGEYFYERGFMKLP
ncbi:histone-lysine N-methyltransferase SETMAR-like [Trichonephila clavipes]|nr:histone-lysine N-methyltransferase SETMAR-like [Trichonephila clavipes]